MKLLMSSVAAVAIAGVVQAQEAFITQIGDDNAGGNFSFNDFTNDPNLQVIGQQGNGLTAVNVSNGRGNLAWAQQTNVVAPGVSGPFTAPTDPGAPHESLIWQDGDFNAAVNVALDENFTPAFCNAFGCTPGDAGAPAIQQTIQAGDRNIAVNWSQDSTVALPTPTVLSDADVITNPVFSLPGSERVSFPYRTTGEFGARVRQRF